MVFLNKLARNIVQILNTWPLKSSAYCLVQPPPMLFDVAVVMVPIRSGLVAITLLRSSSVSPIATVLPHAPLKQSPFLYLRASFWGRVILSISWLLLTLALLGTLPSQQVDVAPVSAVHLQPWMSERGVVIWHMAIRNMVITGIPILTACQSACTAWEGGEDRSKPQ